MLVRYSEQNGRFFLRPFPTEKEGNVLEVLSTGLLAQQPDWLAPIINVAKLGKHGRYPTLSSDLFIVWFDIAPDFTFKEFVDVHGL